MSKNVVVSVVTKKLTVAGDTVAGVFRTTLSSGTADVVQDSPDGTVTFTAVDPGNYIVTMARLDANGVQIGEAVVTGVTVPVDTVDVDVPDTITVTLS